MEKPTMGCPECGGSIPSAPSSGRPATYCGAACRRSAEYAVRRAQVLLTRAGRAHQDARLRHAVAEPWEKKPLQARADFWAEEVDRLRGEMRSLLAGVGNSVGDTSGTTEARP